MNVIGIAARNSLEWFTVDVACIISGLTSVTLYDTLGPEATEYILNQCELKSVFVEAKQIRELVELKKAGKANFLKTLILLDAGEVRDVKGALDAGLSVFTIATLINTGVKSRTPLPDPASESIFTICYTSGTTGYPKGAMITHRNILVMLTGLKSLDIEFDENDVHLSYLPLAHIFERVVSVVMMLCGASIGFYHGNV